MNCWKAVVSECLNTAGGKTQRKFPSEKNAVPRGANGVRAADDTASNAATEKLQHRAQNSPEDARAQSPAGAAITAPAAAGRACARTSLSDGATWGLTEQQSRRLVDWLALAAARSSSTCSFSAVAVEVSK